MPEAVWLNIFQCQRQIFAPADQHMIARFESAGPGLGVLGCAHQNLAKAVSLDQIFCLFAEIDAVLYLGRRFSQS